jgi:dienelactone hydrolase
MVRVKAVFLVIATMLAPLRAEQPAVTMPAEAVEIPLNPLPFVLKGILRHPEGGGRFPAVVLLPACGRFADSVDQQWGQTLSSWGYVALTLDVFTPRGIVGNNTCLFTAPPEIAEDAYRGLSLLAKRRDVDRSRVFVVGFGRGGSLAFAAVERGGVERTAKRKFRGAVAFYPPCGNEKGVMAVATMIIVGARQQLEACRKMADGEDDNGISRRRGAGAPIRLAIVTDAYGGFDLPFFEKSVDVRGHHFEYSKAATDQAKGQLREFLETIAK